jgi:transcriptional regulator with XRE-family HTH domain
MPITIGERIKALRSDRGMTLAELAEQVGLSAGYLSQIERDKITPALSALLDIASALNVGPRYFFETETEAAFITRSDTAQAAIDPQAAFQRLALTPEVGSKRLSVDQVVLAPGETFAGSGPFSGEDFLFVISGELTLKLDEEGIVLAAGDSIHYDAAQRCQWTNAGNSPCIVLMGRAASLEHIP